MYTNNRSVYGVNYDINCPHQSMTQSSYSIENTKCDVRQCFGTNNRKILVDCDTGMTKDVEPITDGLKRALPTSSNDFITARDILEDCSPSKKKRTGIKNRKKITVQSNTLKNYFKPLSKPASVATNIIKAKPNLDDVEYGHSDSSSSSGLKQLKGKLCREPVNQVSDKQQANCKQVYQAPQVDGKQVCQADDQAPQADVGHIGELPQEYGRQVDDGPQTDGRQNDEQQNITWFVSDDDDDDHYGLLGTERPKSEEVNYFIQLPVEAIENIFCYIPYVNLCLTLKHVCRSWNNIISRPMFLKWKKTYLCLLHGAQNKRQELLEIMQENRMNVKCSDTALLHLVGYMKNFHPTVTFNVNEFLSKHPEYTQVIEIIRRKLPECIQDQEPCCWSVVACLVILSKTVADIQTIMRYLTLSACTTKDIIEWLYCMASFLFVFKSLCYNGPWTGIHYRVYYALYLFENDSNVTCQSLKQTLSESLGQQSIVRYSLAESSLKYTHEQLRICNHNMKDGEIIKIVAFAGTGKTTTLIRYTQLRPSTKFLLLLYNKAAQLHCAKYFPSNVTCKTIHALARGSTVCRRYAKKIGNLHVGDVISVLPWRKGHSAYEYAGLVIKTVNNFLPSADDRITLGHVPFEVMARDGGMQYMEIKKRELVLKDAIEIWTRATNPHDLSVKLSHDGYLKVYQLSKPCILGYDVILIDEAQDQTPAVIDILIHQTQPKILVGDPHQQIYSFRGATNAMDTIPATKTYCLTQSFRFGSQIAFVANCCIGVLKNVHTKTLVGNKSQDAIDGSCHGQLAIITRTNFQLFSEAVKICCYNNDNRRVAFVGGVNSVGFDVILDIYALSQSSAERGPCRIKHPLVSKFSSITDLMNFAKSTYDNELLGKIKIATTYGYQLPSVIQQIKSKAVDDIYVADIILSTAHKSKGLEFNSVCVTNDFMCSVHQHDVQDLQPDECNLLYVAVTRAKKSLILSTTLKSILEHSGEKAAQSLRQIN